jgi:hypothetical protein
MAEEKAKAVRGEPPQYELTEAAYINDQLLAEGDVVYTKGIPGPHMLPLNEAAREMCAKHSKAMQFADPIRDLTIVGEGATVLQAVHNNG